MSRKAKTVGTVRERERERELHFSNRECGFVQQSDTHTHIILTKLNKNTKNSYTYLNKGAVLLSVLINMKRNFYKHRLFIYVHFLRT